MTTPDDFAALAARVRRLEDIEAIRTLRNRYHSAINDGRFDEIGGLFTPDAVVGAPGCLSILILRGLGGGLGCVARTRQSPDSPRGSRSLSTLASAHDTGPVA